MSCKHSCIFVVLICKDYQIKKRILFSRQKCTMPRYVPDQIVNIYIEFKDYGRGLSVGVAPRRPLGEF